jgi:hypothetical protein
VGPLLFSFFVHTLGPAPIAILFELDFALHTLAIFAGPIVNPFALLALEFNESVL